MMKPRYIYCGIAVTLMLLLGGCEKRPKGVLSDDEMVALMTDMELGEAYAQQNCVGEAGREKSRELGDGILAAHGVTRKQLDMTLDWYGHNMEKYDKLYERIEKNIEKKRRHLAKQSNSSKQNQRNNENDLWLYPRNRVISSLSDNRSMVFSIDKLELGKGDIIEWKMRFTSVYGGNGMLGADYEDGTTTYITSIHQSRDFSMRLQLDSAKKVKRLFGVVNSDGQSRSLWIDSISLRRQALDEDMYQTIRSQKLLGKPAVKKSENQEQTVQPENMSGDMNSVDERQTQTATTVRLRSVSPQKLIGGGNGNADRSLHKQKK